MFCFNGRILGFKKMWFKVFYIKGKKQICAQFCPDLVFDFFFTIFGDILYN